MAGGGTSTGTGTGKEGESTTNPLSSSWTEGITRSQATPLSTSNKHSLFTTIAPSFGTLFATCDNLMDVFFDGVRHPNHTSMANWGSPTKFDIPAGTRMLAIRFCNTDLASSKGILASIGGNSQIYSVKTNDTWHMSC